jgi:Uma2 family endonuclease
MNRKRTDPVEVAAPPRLRAGDHLTRDEFLDRWENEPTIKFAELIGGVVYMPSPLSLAEGEMLAMASTWIGTFSAYTPGARGSNNATTLIADDCAQPDVHLRILPDYGGETWNEGKLLGGPPELVVEVCASSAAYDLHAKYKLYQSAGVREYVAVLLYEQEIRWHRLGNNGYHRVAAGEDGLWKSKVFPGLWLDGAALLAGDLPRVLAALQRGIDSKEHADFVKKLARKKAK